MNVGVISMRYAKALFAYGKEMHAGDRLYEEMQKLSQCFIQVPAFRQALDNPMLAPQQKVALIAEAAGGKASEALSHFVNLVLREKREKYMQLMAVSYIDLYRKDKKINIGKLVTAYPISKETEEHIRKLMARDVEGSIEFETLVDPTIEGGFIFQMGTYRMDASVATQFKRIKEQFIEKNRRIV